MPASQIAERRPSGKLAASPRADRAARPLRALAAVLLLLAIPTGAADAAPPYGWTLVGHGFRRGSLYRGELPGIGAADLYLPAGPHDHSLPVVFVDGDRSAAATARATTIDDLADQLSWDGTTPPFAALVLDTPAANVARIAVPWARKTLGTPRGAGSAFVGIGGRGGSLLHATLDDPRHVTVVATLGGDISARAQRTDALLAIRRAPLLRQTGLRLFASSPSDAPRAGTTSVADLDDMFRRLHVPLRTIAAPTADTGSALRHELGQALSYALTPDSTRLAQAGAAGMLPSGWTQITSGPAGGTVWQGSIPDTVVPGAHRDALVYLPPGVDPARRYPVVYLLHGLRGSPYSFIGGLRFAAIVDGLVASDRVPPFIAVAPAAGRTIAYDGEWAGPWERYVVHDVIPWTHAHLPVLASSTASSIAGFSAGGYGALDIGFRHPGLFHTLESWSGYYTAPHDGPLTGASATVLAAHDPSRLAQTESPALRADGVRVFVSLGRQEQHVQAPARRFAHLLASLGIAHQLLIVRGHHNGRTWRAQLPAALEYALGAGSMARPK